MNRAAVDIHAEVFSNGHLFLLDAEGAGNGELGVKTAHCLQQTRGQAVGLVP